MFAIVPEDGTAFSTNVLSALEELTAKTWLLPYTLRVDSPTKFQHTTTEHDDLWVRDLITEVDVVDIGLSYFNGTDRNPVLTPNVDRNSVVVLTPHYRQIQLYGLDVQATIEDWAWKMETIAVLPDRDDDYFSSVSGFKYTLVGLSGSSTDLGLIVEYQYDQRDADSASLQQNDIVVGTRWVLNNADSTEILLIGSADLDDSSVIMSVEAQHRLTDNWSMSVEARYFG